LRKNLAGRPGFRRRADSLMVRLNSESKTGNRLFFCANGTAECEPLARELDGEVELWMLESGYGHIPGTQDAIEEISSRHLREILQIVGEGPIQLLGYSFACLHATEIAAQATARGSLVTFLGWLDNRNCFTGVFGLYRHLEVRWENLKWSWLAARGKGTYLRRLGGIILRALTRRLGLCRGESHPPPSAAVHRVLGPCRDPYRILPSRLPLHLFVACDHPLRNSLFPTLGWRRADYPLLRVWKSAGNHHTMGLSGNATTLARVLRHALTVQPTALAACEAPQARALI
ncbi:MAG TPA: thioesterase domain-containing protein, partial [Prosthecobacter sp.]|nr:thioesterase domain-containing protein [Prosthecobacter sp.]